MGQVETVETAIEPRFQEHFVEAMAIPHETADYTHLRKVVDLPVPKPSPAAGENRDRRGRRASAPPVSAPDSDRNQAFESGPTDSV